jgi:branched-chain amino acid transport system permease protein
LSTIKLPAGRSVKTGWVVLAVLGLILLVLPYSGVSIYYISILLSIFLYIVMTASLRMVSLSGQISLGHAGLMCAGAYTSAVIAKNLAWTPWLTIPLGALFSFALALLVAIPFSRLRGLYFTMISLFFGLAVIAVNQVFEPVTGGQSGISGIPALFGISKTPYYYFNLGVMVVCLLVLYRLEHSRTGLTWKAVAQSHSVASSTGIDEVRQRIICFGIGGLFAGLAGAVYTHTVSTVLSITNFGFFSSIYIFIYMMVGGVNSFWGPAIGTAAILLVQTFARSLKEYVPFIPAGVLLIVLFLMPRGLVSFPERIWHLYNKLRVPRAAVDNEENRNAP